MLHNIIVKWNEGVDKAQTLQKVTDLYSTATDIPGIKGVSIKPNIVDRSNRYDLMIALEMDIENLPTWDNSQLHKTWKEEFGSLIEKKCIFDYEQ